jgi:hypothetical protein
MGKTAEKELVAILANAQDKIDKAARKRMPSLLRWKHKKSGTVYWIEGITLLEETLEPLVNYVKQADDNGRPASENPIRWSRPVDNFLEKFEPIFEQH